MCPLIALQYHPDSKSITASHGANSPEFIKASEAWRVLSRSEFRLAYDQKRERYLGRSGPYSSAFNGTHDYGNVGVKDSSEIPQNFNTQRNNFSQVRHNACSNWQEMQDKYKSEKWRNLPLNDRKKSRSRPIANVRFSLLSVAVPVILCGGVAMMITKTLE